MKRLTAPVVLCLFALTVPAAKALERLNAGNARFVSKRNDAARLVG